MSVDTKAIRALAERDRPPEDNRRAYPRYEEVAVTLFALADEVDKLREFASYVMREEWNEAGDYGSLQDKAEALGLIELRPIQEEDSIDGEDEHYFLVWEK